ncbi:1-phosphatidylinositol phosphodiesterase [Tritrichomonas foetus]|uniref:1-phosphatidylinositol phosphodiesterase n=1 Tax=Tritrichomonas foetus TaxID=1144522 RepID=A0A1J4KAV7_9EUKA|nr:1-phosphatidylinositol phosphodiesterase [Tritrichomonas foetus]|eukprot:OHT08090.1 1-phosphatidylinositol phosphodiesterase [Tritrichomonas foetus]
MNKLYNNPISLNFLLNGLERHMLPIVIFLFTFSSVSIKKATLIHRSSLTSNVRFNFILKKLYHILSAKPCPKCSDWMSKINDNRKLTELSIPGTHETCAFNGGLYYKCQNLGLKEQLEAGIRFLDIRCRHIENVFTIHHAAKYQKINFGGGVRDVCIQFLKEHPNEFIIMLIKPEHTTKKCTRSFEETMQSYIKCYEKYFYLEEGNPTVSEMRGKIVVLRPFKSSIIPMGNYLEYVDNKKFTTNYSIIATVQDCYHILTIFHRSSKWKKVVSLLQESQKNRENEILYINYGSGSGGLCCPKTASKYINNRIVDYLISNKNVHAGIIMLDFFEKYTDYDFVAAIINRNHS